MSDDPMTAEGKTPEPNEGGLTSGEITPQPAENPTTAEEKAPQSAEENAPPAENAATSDEKTPQPAEKALVSGENTSQPAEKASVSGDKTPQLAEKALVSSEKTPTAAETPGAGHSGLTASGEPTLSPDSLFWAPLNYGWVRELVYRNSLGPNNKKADAYYKSPAGKKYRSLKEIERAMAEGKPGFDGLRVENFTYNQYPLGVNDPSREVIRGADPTRQFPTTKRSFEAGETDSPAKKKPKTLLAKPKMSATPPSKTKKVTAPPKTFSRPTIVGPALTYSPLTTVSTPIRSYPQQTTIVGARAMGYGSGIRPVPTNLLMNPRRTLQNVPAKRFTVPPSPGKSAEEIVCEPAIYDLQPFAGVDMEQDQSCGEDLLKIESNGSDVKGELSDERERGESGEGSNHVSLGSSPNADGTLDNGIDDEDCVHQAPSLEADSTTKCLCGMCVVPVTEEKIICCSAVDVLVRAKDPHGCITMHPSFKNLIMDKDVLDMMRHHLSLKTKNRNKKKVLNAQVPMNITWRYIAFKQFITWINKCSHIGQQNKVAIPSCVVHAVRVRFPEPNGKYRVLSFM